MGKYTLVVTDTGNDIGTLTGQTLSLGVLSGSGPKGDGFTGGSYDTVARTFTFTSNDGLGFTTDAITFDVVEDTTPQLGGDLDLNSSDITGTGDVNITGSVTASAGFTGDVTGNVTGDLTGNVTGDLTGDVTGNVTGNITGDVTGNADTATALETARTIAGQSFDGTANITIAATDLSDTDQALATTSDVTFNDVVVSGDLTVSGTTTTVNTETINLADNVILVNSNYTGSSPTEDGGIEVERGTLTNKTLVWDETADKWTVGSETFLAATFEGNLTGNVTGDLTGDVTGNVTGDLTGDVTGNVTGNVTGDLTGDVTGNADTATTLETARTIGGVSFDGSANIDLAGVNTTGNQDTSGNAATATALETSRTISLTGDATGSASFDGSADASITVTIADDSHNHTIANVDGLQTALDGKAANGANSDITSLSGLTTALSVAQGGTGATTAAAARTNLDVDQAGEALALAIALG